LFVLFNEEDGFTFGPLDSFVGVCLFGHLFDLPGTPAFVSEGPVLDLLIVLEYTTVDEARAYLI